MPGSKRSARRRDRQEPQRRLKVARPDELLAIIPYLVGFHPDESIVAVFVKSGRVALTARMDLPPESAADDLARQIDHLATRERADALALVAYGAASLSAHRLLARLMDGLSKHVLTDVLYVGHGRWWSLTCTEDCCPPCGTPFDLDSHTVSAAAVFAGLGTLANRQELAASISGPPEAELPRLQALADSLLGELKHSEDHRPAARLMGSLIDSATSDPGVLDEGTCVLLALLVSEGHIRDLAWALLSPTNAEEHVRLWAGVVAHVPPTLAAAPLCLLGMAAWVYGSGALLNCCCERVAQVDPSYSVIKTSTAEPSFGTNRCYLPYLRDAETLAERDRQCCGKSAHERFLHLFGNRWGSRCRLDGALKSHRWPDDASDHCLSRHSGALKPLGCVP